MKHKYTLVLLFVVVIVFSILGSLFPYEGFEDLKVPQCNSSDIVDGSKTCEDDNYILKTQIVPPVCPSCPPYLSEEPDEKTSEEASVEEEETSTKPLKNTQKEKSNVESKFSFKQTSETKQNEKNNKRGLFNNQGGSGLLSGFNKSENQTNINEYKQEIEQLKEQLKQLKQYDGNAPPCPACERCPEPSFDCKKVPNYRSSSVSNYLPMPVLNDFSTFT